MTISKKIWKLSDGTEVELGGVVRGKSRLAVELSIDARPRNRPFVTTTALEFPPLDVDDSWCVHCWVRENARRHGVTVVEAPEVDPPVVEYDFDPSAVY
jgi:hypothetical protein